MRPNQSRGVATYLLFTFALSSVFYFLIAKSGQVGGGWGAYIGCLMWCPGVAALLSCKYLGRDLSTLGWKWGKTRYEIACYLIPLGYATAIEPIRFPRAFMATGHAFHQGDLAF